MAYLVNNTDEEKEKKASASNADVLAPQADANAAPLGQPTATMGGKGGSGGWTNIQNYLQANQGGNNPSNILQQQVGSTYDKEKQTLEDTASKTKTAAAEEAKRTDIGKDKASKLVEAAGQKYQYNVPTQSSDYQTAIKAIQDPLGYTYNKPIYDYAVSAPFQKYQAGLSKEASPGQFNQMMADVYGGIAGRGLSSGQKALQTQLQGGDEQFDPIRQALATKYGEYNPLVEQTRKDVGTEIENQGKTFEDNKNKYLETLAGKDWRRDNKDVPATKAYGGLASEYKQGLQNVVDAERARQDEFRRSIALPADYWSSSRDYRDPNSGMMIHEPGQHDVHSLDYAGDTAGLENVSGYGSEMNRGSWNAILDALQATPTDKIGQSANPYKLGDYREIENKGWEQDWSGPGRDNINEVNRYSGQNWLKDKGGLNLDERGRPIGSAVSFPGKNKKNQLGVL